MSFNIFLRSVDVELLNAQLKAVADWRSLVTGSAHFTRWWKYLCRQGNACDCTSLYIIFCESTVSSVNRGLNMRDLECNFDEEDIATINICPMEAVMHKTQIPYPRINIKVSS
jgi:hypothetical protein